MKSILDTLWLKFSSNRFTGSTISLLLLFTILLWFLRVPEWWAVGLTLSAITTFYKHKLPLIWVTSILFCVFSNNLGWTYIEALQPISVLLEKWNTYCLRSLLLFITLLITYSLVFLIKKNRKLNQRPILILLTLFFISAIVAAMQFHTVGGVYATVCIALFGKFIWFFAYDLKDRASAPTLFFPFWTSKNVPIPKGQLHMKEINAKPEQLQNTQRSGLRLLVWVTVLFLVHQITEHLVFNRMNNISTFLKIPTLNLSDIVTHHSLSVVSTNNLLWQNWLIVFCTASLYLIKYTIDYGIIVAIVRMTGYSAPRQVYRPLQSRSFAELLRRILYYYSELLLVMFILPIHRELRFLKSKNIRQFISITAGVTLGGICYHFSRDFLPYANYGLTKAMPHLLSLIPYFIIMGALSASSVYLRRKKRASGTKNIKMISPLIMVYFTFYCLVIFIKGNLSLWFGSWSGYLHFLQILFPIHLLIPFNS